MLLTSQNRFPKKLEEEVTILEVNVTMYKATLNATGKVTA